MSVASARGTEFEDSKQPFQPLFESANRARGPQSQEELADNKHESIALSVIRVQEPKPRTHLLKSTDTEIPTVPIYIGDGLSVLVPKSFTFESSINENPVNLLIFYPVIDNNGVTYDALAVLKGLDPRCAGYAPHMLKFNQELYTQIIEHFQHVNNEHIRTLPDNNQYRNAKSFVATASGSFYNYGTASEIQLLAQRMDVEIKHENPGRMASIAVDKNPKFGPVHRLGLTLSATNASSMQAFSALVTSNLSITPMDCIMIPLLSLWTAKTLHSVTKDPKKILTSMNNLSVPTTLLYTATGMGTYAVNYGLKSVVLSKMTAAGATGAAVTTVSFLLPVAVGVSAVCVYQFGPRVGTYAKEKAIKVATGIKDCAYGIGELFKACGSRLWGGSTARPATAATGPVLSDAKAALLPSPSGRSNI